MASNIEILASVKREHIISESKSVWLIAKPEPQSLLRRIKDAIGVIRGEYEAVYFSKP